MNYLLVVQDFIRTPRGSVFSGRQQVRKGDLPPICPTSPRRSRPAKYIAQFDGLISVALSDAPTVLAQLPGAFEHFNEIHPHSSLKMMSPREFRRRQNHPAREG